LICGVSEDTNKLLERGEMISSNENVNEVVKYFDSNIKKIDFKAV